MERGGVHGGGRVLQLREVGQRERTAVVTRHDFAVEFMAHQAPNSANKIALEVEWTFWAKTVKTAPFN